MIHEDIIDITEKDLEELEWDLALPDNGLTAEKVFTGLLDFGLFSEKLPPCFTSIGLAESTKKFLIEALDEKNLKEIGERAHDYVRHDTIRDINIPRHLGIPHPESYGIQALAIEKHWKEIISHCKKPSPQISRIHVRQAGKGRIFQMNYKGTERYQLEENEIEWQSGAKFIVKADIANCFHSIYTHSIPWAIHGLENAKKSTGLGKLYGNLLDKCTQNIRDKQTNGLLIGPHSSNIISEIVLTSIDCELQSKGYSHLVRYIDDYTYYAETYEKAELFLRDLGLSLRKYEMSLNEKKTRILSLPRPSLENWIQELQRFPFPRNEEIRFSVIRSFLDLALEHAQTSGASTPLNYAIKMLAGDSEVYNLNSRAKRLYVQEAINLAISYPYLVPVLDKAVFDKYHYNGINEKIANFSTALVKLGLQKIYPDTIAHALYYALKHNFLIPRVEEKLIEILSLEDCITNVLLLEYANRNKLKKVTTAIKSYTTKLKKAGPRDIDRNWLLVYQTWTAKELSGKGQSFLALLKKENFKFLDIPIFEEDDLL